MFSNDASAVWRCLQQGRKRRSIWALVSPLIMYIHTFQTLLIKAEPLFIRSKRATCETPKPCFYHPPTPSTPYPKRSTSEMPVCQSTPFVPWTSGWSAKPGFSYCVVFFWADVEKVHNKRDEEIIFAWCVLYVSPLALFAKEFPFFHFLSMWKSPYWETVTI